MYLITFVLHNPDLLEELIDIWDKSGADGVTVVFSSGMGRLRQNQGLRDDIPLIPSLNDFYKARQTLSRTIFTVIKEESTIDNILSATQNLVGDLNQPETGLFIVTPVIRVYGLEKGNI